MKVEDSQQITAATLKGKPAGNKEEKVARQSPQTEESTMPSAPARVEISEESKEAQRVAELARATLEVRQEKVEALREKIEAGEYKVDSQKVADKMLRQLLSELIR